MQPVIPDLGTLTGFDPLLGVLALVGSLILGLIVAVVYKMTHRGLSYSVLPS
jgi:hypothetical protein